MSGPVPLGEATVAVGNAAFVVASAPVAAPAGSAASVASADATSAGVIPAKSGASLAAAADSSLPCSQGRVGEGCAPLAAGSSETISSQLPTQEASAAGAASLPPRNLPLQAGSDFGAASTPAASTAKHTATVGHPSKPQTFAKQPEGPGIGGALFALILVVSLILALGWLARRMPGFTRATGGGNALRIVGSLTLGPRDRVVVVDVGGTQLLLGVGQNGMTTLHTLTEPLPVAQPSQGTPSLQNLATPFAQLLQKHLGKKP